MELSRRVGTVKGKEQVSIPTAQVDDAAEGAIRQVLAQKTWHLSGSKLESLRVLRKCRHLPYYLENVVRVVTGRLSGAKVKMEGYLDEVTGAASQKLPPHPPSQRRGLILMVSFPWTLPHQGTGRRHRSPWAGIFPLADRYRLPWFFPQPVFGCRALTSPDNQPDPQG